MSLRILLLNYEFPPLGGGAATASAQIARHLSARGAEVAVLTSHFRGLPRREQRDGYTIHRVPAMRRRLDQCSMPEMGAFVAGAALPALRLAAEFRPDIMHVFFGVPTGPVGLMVSRLRGIPYLLSLRGGDVPGFMGQELARAHSITMPLTRRVWSAAGAIVVNSQGLHALASNTVPGRKIEIVPNGVDLDTFRPADESAQGDGKARLLFVGRLASQKGLPDLLAALSMLDPDMRSRVELELVGSGPDEGQLRSQAVRLGIGDMVRFSGWVPRSDIPDRYREADVSVLPSLDEGMPNVVLEAMGSGLPVLATDIRGNRELVQPGVNGLLVPPSSPAALHSALVALLAGGEMRRRMGAASREVAARYSWAATADRYLALSNEILARNAVGVRARGNTTPAVGRIKK